MPSNWMSVRGNQDQGLEWQMTTYTVCKLWECRDLLAGRVTLLLGVSPLCLISAVSPL